MAKPGDVIYPIMLDDVQIETLVMIIDFVLPYYQHHPKRVELETIKNKLEKAYGLDI